MDWSIFGARSDETPDKKQNPTPNGPRGYETLTNGQIRRQRAREIAHGRRKQGQRSRNAYMAQRLRDAFIRGHVQAATKRGSVMSKEILISDYGFANLDEAVKYVEDAVAQRG